ncbi:MAG: hypothetical protein QFB86_00610 [Patescibacteria group bacterium]|nr:hypothetical protein [Patescibacteria group bacterium]
MANYNNFPNESEHNERYQELRTVVGALTGLVTAAGLGETITTIAEQQPTIKTFAYAAITAAGSLATRHFWNE